MPQWLQSVWNSIETLSSVNLLAQSIVALALLATFFFTAVGLVAAWRKEALERLKDLETQKIIAEANESAGDAVERAANLEAQSERSRLEQVRLQVEVERFRERNLRLESEVEKERIERLKLQEQVAPRRLTTKQKAALPKALEKRGLGGVLAVYVFIGTDDAMPFSFDLIEAINRAPGWKASHKGQHAGGGGLTGLAIIVKDPQRVPPRAIALQRALEEVGIAALGASCKVLGGDCDDDYLTLFVAPKP